MNDQPYVFIVDDDEAVRDSLKMVLETMDINCATYDSAEEFLGNYNPEIPGCLILDVNLPGINGVELHAELNRRNIRLPIIFLTSYGDVPMSVRAIKAGAVDFLLKPIAIPEIIECIQTELQKEIKRHEQNKIEMEFIKNINNLSAREMEILPLVLAGITTKEIALQLNISYRTVEIHRTQILKKTGANSFLELASQCTACNIQFKTPHEES
jgi:FixJ family two-component response regulator